MIVKNFSKKKINITVKQELLISLKENVDLEEPGLNETADALIDTLAAVRIINHYEAIIETK